VTTTLLLPVLPVLVVLRVALLAQALFLEECQGQASVSRSRLTYATFSQGL